MKRLPPNVIAYKRTPEFTERSIPQALLGSHTTKVGVWGLIVVLEGSLIYRILEPAVEEVLLTANSKGVVEPAVRHQVAPLERVRFYVEFYRGSEQS